MEDHQKAFFHDLAQHHAAQAIAVQANVATGAVALTDLLDRFCETKLAPKVYGTVEEAVNERMAQHLQPAASKAVGAFVKQMEQSAEELRDSLETSVQGNLRDLVDRVLEASLPVAVERALRAKVEPAIERALQAKLDSAIDLSLATALNKSLPSAVERVMFEKAGPCVEAAFDTHADACISRAVAKRLDTLVERSLDAALKRRLAEQDSDCRPAKRRQPSPEL